MIKFLFGAHGSGKTVKITDMLRADAENGISSVLLVPEQEAVQTEHMTLTYLPPSAQLTLEVLNFSRLYNRVCREYGGLSYSYITKPMQHLIMWRVLREVSKLKEFAENAKNDPSFASDMLSTVIELKAAAITPQMLEDTANKFSDSNSLLSAKLHDIALISGTYDIFISEKYSDSADDLAKLCDSLDEHDFFKGKNVYIDSFTSFTAAEHRIIEKIFRSANNTVISIPLPDRSYSDISTVSINRSFDLLKRNASRWGEVEYEVLARDTAKDSPLTYLAEHIWKLEGVADKEQLPSCQGRIIMESCDNPYSEAEATASHILELLRNGERCGSIAIIMRNADKYRGIIEPALEKAELPFFLSEKSDLCSLAPIKFILTALRIRLYNWRKNDVISHVKTGLCSFSVRDSDVFEEYINTWNISGSRFTDGDWSMNPDGFEQILSDRANMILSTANAVRKELCQHLEELFILLDAAKNVPDMCHALYRYMENSELRRKSSELAKKEMAFNNKKTAAELACVYDVILNTLADIGETLSDLSLDVEEFYTVLKTVFDNTEVGTIPTSIDEITVGSASMLRLSHPKYVFVLGLCDGEFPATVEASGILSASDRDFLSDYDLTLGGDSDSRASDELMFVKNAFSAPDERLYLLTSKADAKGGKRTPSLPFIRAQNLFCDLAPHTFYGRDLTYLSGSPKSAAAQLRNISNPSDKQAAVRAISEHLPKVAELSSADVSTGVCRVSPENVRRVLGDKLYISPSSFEKYVKCPFGYFASNVLSLREVKYARFGKNHIGTFIHHVLENAIRFAVPSDVNTPAPDADQVKQKIHDIIRDYVREITPDETLQTNRIKHLYSRLTRLSILIVDNIMREFADSEFRPAYFELGINKGNSPCSTSAIRLENGAELFLNGIVDRVDVWKNGDDVFIRVVDYKTGSKSFSLSDLDYGINTQMLLYLFSLCTSSNRALFVSDGDKSDASPIPAGVVYLSSAISQTALESFDSTEEQILSLADSKLSRDGILLDDEDVLLAMSHSGSKEILLGISKTGDSFVGSSLVSNEEFMELHQKIRQTLSDIGNKIYAGIADCSPLEFGKLDPCKFCTVNQMCRKNNFK